MITKPNQTAIQSSLLIAAANLVLLGITPPDLIRAEVAASCRLVNKLIDQNYQELPPLLPCRCGRAELQQRFW